MSSTACETFAKHLVCETQQVRITWRSKENVLVSLLSPVKHVATKSTEFSQMSNAEYQGGLFLSLLEELDLVLVPSGSSLVQGSGLLASGMAPDSLRVLKGDSFPHDHFQYLLNNAIVTERKLSAKFVYGFFLITRDNRHPPH